MAADRLTAARQHVDTAQAKLDAALLEPGADTDRARALLAEAEAHLARLTAAETAAAAAPDPEREARIRREAAARIEQAAARILAPLAPPAPPTALDLPVSLAESVLRLQLEQTAAQAGLDAHDREAARIRERQHALREERAAIVRARAAGDCDDEAQGRRLALLAADLDGLDRLAGDHAARRPPAPDHARLAQLQTLLDAALFDAETRASLEWAQTLETALINLADRLSRRAGSRADWRFRLSPRWQNAALRGVW